MEIYVVSTKHGVDSEYDDVMLARRRVHYLRTIGVTAHISIRRN
jgi:hypothetical protein